MSYVHECQKYDDISSYFQMSSLNYIINLASMLMFQGRVKTMAENYGDTALDPTPSFDCHISKNAYFDLASVSHQGAFDSSQVCGNTNRLLSILARTYCEYKITVNYVFRSTFMNTMTCVTWLSTHVTSVHMLYWNSSTKERAKDFISRGKSIVRNRVF